MIQITQKTLIPGYVVDTSALINLWRVHYCPDVFQTLWNKDLEEIIHRKSLIAPQEVFNELQSRDDDLLKWAKNHKDMFIGLDKEQITWVRDIEKEYPELVDSKKTTAVADPFVISLAMSKDWTVITSEKSSPGKPRIPDVCRGYEVKCIGIMEFFRERGWEY
ncbi:MAG: DUF4411 family protein [Theionarchaea archaeon]|nr:DUF4411 family protein [Theionarchaea archaeon]